jgi:hypothetical protein
MADDDIVQKITITAEDDASAVFKTIGQNAQQSFAQIQQAGKSVAQPIQQSIQQIGTTAQQSFGAAATAAQTMGTNVSGLSSVVSRFASVFTTAFAGFAGLFRSSSQAADEHAAAVKGTGAAAAEAAPHHTALRGEIRALGEVMTVSGVGPMREFTTVLASIGLHLGPIAVAIAAIGLTIKTMVEAAKQAVEAFRALQQASDLSGLPIDQLSKMQQALQTMGMSAKDAGDLLARMFQQTQEAANTAGVAIQESALKVIQAQQKVAQSYLAVQQAQLAGRQTALQIQQLQQQLIYLPQIQAIESRRVDLAVKDAQARYQLLVLQKQLRDGLIDEDEFAEKSQEIKDKALDREIEKAKIELDNAKLQQEMLPQQQALQERQLELQQQSLRLQQQANQQSQQRAAVELRLAVILERVARASDLGPLVEKMKGALQGIPQTFDPLTTAADKAKAALIAIGQSKIPLPVGLAELLKNVDALSRIQLGQALKIPPEAVTELAKEGDNLQHLIDQMKGLTPEQVHNLGELGENMNKLVAAFSSLMQTIGGESAATLATNVGNLAEKINDLNKALDNLTRSQVIEFFKQVSEGGDEAGRVMAQIVQFFVQGGEQAGEAMAKLSQVAITVFRGISETAIEAFNAMLQPIQNVINTIGGWLDALWQKIVSAARGLFGLQQPSGAGASGGGMAAGGVVYGRGGVDNVPAWLSAGEFVMSVAAVQRYGSGFMHAINQMRLASVPRYATGGLIGAPIPSLSSAMASGPGSGQRVLTLNIEGRSFTGMNVPENVAQQLERFAIHSQIASAGRKQSWRK